MRLKPIGILLAFLAVAFFVGKEQGHIGPKYLALVAGTATLIIFVILFIFIINKPARKG